ncbi:MAG: competence protein ComEC, partial [Gammaproteobacteria bacterium HGW-Gammaproteobacteria-14]
SDLRADVLQVPHHGSATSSSYALLRAVSPSWAFVSAGYGNRFGHPVPLVTQRYQEMQIPLQVTGFGGMLIYGRAGEKSPISLRDARPFPWRLPTPVVE